MLAELVSSIAGEWSVIIRYLQLRTVSDQVAVKDQSGSHNEALYIYFVNCDLIFMYLRSCPYCY